MKKILLSVLALLAFAGSGTAQNLPSYVPANGLVGWWPFNGNANDESGNNNNGTVNGATLATDRFGNVGKAYDFNTGNSIALPNGSNIQGNNPRTISFWIKPEIANFATYTIYKGGTNGSGNDFTIWLRKNVGNTYQLHLRRFQDDVVTDSLPIDLDWGYYTIVYDGTVNSNIKFFINGIEHVGRALAGSGLTFNTTSTQPEFGHNIDQLGVHRYFDGVIDDIAIYNRALSITEITQLYTGQVATSANCPTFPASLTQGLVGYWPFCGNALDESGNNNHGTVNGATLTTDRFGNQGSAYGFDGVNDNITTSYVFPTGSLSKSYSVWFKIDDLGQRAWIIGNNLDCTTPGSIGTYGLFLEGNLPFSRLLFNGNSVDVDFESSLISNTWYNAVVCYDGFSVKCYLNGILKNFQLTTLNTMSSNLLFGGRSVLIPSTCPEEFLEGNIDDIAIWNRALSQNEITQLYNQGICQTSITVTDTLLIHTGITSYNPVAYGNTLKVWPNPGNQDITLDAGNISSMQGWKYKVANGLGQIVKPETAINQQQTLIDLTTWGGSGIYYLHLINPQGIAVEIKKIVLAP